MLGSKSVDIYGSFACEALYSFSYVCQSSVATMDQKKKRRKEIPTGETVKHLLPLPHKHTHTGTQTEKEQDAEAAFESCPVAVNINSR